MQRTLAKSEGTKLNSKHVQQKLLIYLTGSCRQSSPSKVTHPLIWFTDINKGKSRIQCILQLLK